MVGLICRKILFLTEKQNYIKINNEIRLVPLSLHMKFSIKVKKIENTCLVLAKQLKKNDPTCKDISIK